MNLVLISQFDVEWQWLGSFDVPGRHGDPVRIERWEAHCRHCYSPYETTGKLPRKLWQRYAQLLREHGGDPNAEIRIKVPGDICMRCLEIRNCEMHHGSKFQIV